MGTRVRGVWSSCVIAALVCAVAADALAAPAAAAVDDVADVDVDVDVSDGVVAGAAFGAISAGVAAGVALWAIGPAGRRALEGASSSSTEEAFATPLPARPIGGAVLGGAIVVGGVAGGAAGALARGGDGGDAVRGGVAGLVGSAPVAVPVGVAAGLFGSALDGVSVVRPNDALVLLTSGPMFASGVLGAIAVGAGATMCGLGDCAMADRITQVGAEPDNVDDDSHAEVVRLRSRRRAAALASITADIGCATGACLGCSVGALSDFTTKDIATAAAMPVAVSTAMAFGGAALVGEPGVGLAAAVGAAVGASVTAGTMGGSLALLVSAVNDDPGARAAAVGLFVLGAVLGPLTTGLIALLFVLPTVGTVLATCITGDCPIGPMPRPQGLPATADHGEAARHGEEESTVQEDGEEGSKGHGEEEAVVEEAASEEEAGEEEAGEEEAGEEEAGEEEAGSARDGGSNDPAE